MKDIIKFESTPAVFKADFKAAEAYLEKELEKYRLVVTADTVKAAKASATELNKMAGEISAKGKQAVDEVSAPIKTFSADIKKLSAMCKDGRQMILDQVKVFDDVTREKVRELLHDLRETEWISQCIDVEFRKAQFDDLVIQTNLTAKGNLTAKASSALSARIDKDKQHQTEVEMRLLELENKCYKAGLKVPLERIHIEAFLFADQPVYDANLESLLTAEVKRQEDATRRIREEEKTEAERKLAAKVERETFQADMQKRKETEDRIERELVAAQVEESADDLTRRYMESNRAPVESVKTPVQTPTDSIKSGNAIRTVTAVFEVSVPEKVSTERIAEKLKKKLESAGFTSLQSLQVK